MGKTEVKTEAREEMSGKTEIKTEVTLKYGQTGVWFLKYPMGIKEIFPNTEITFNLNDKHDLNHFIGAMRWINSPRVNTQLYMDKDDKQNPYKMRKRWVITKGEENIPNAIKAIKFSATDFHPPDLQEAIKSLAPDYYDYYKQNKR